MKTLSKKIPLFFLIFSVGFSLGIMKWELQARSGFCGIDFPCHRAGHSSVEVVHSFSEKTKRNVYIFGGKTKNGEFLNDVWKYCLDNGKWIKENSSNITMPSGRAYHAMEKSGTGFYIFGGIASDSFMNDVWSYDLSSSNDIKWKRAIDADESTSIDPRAGASAHFADSEENQQFLFIFFGETQYNQQFSSILKLKNDGWEFVSIPQGEESPGARAYHSSWWHEEGVVTMIYGGYGAISQNEKGVLGDVWTFNFKTIKWKMIGGSDSLNPSQNIVEKERYDSLNIPQGRCRASTFKINSDKYILFGGSNCKQNESVVFFNDLWFFSFIRESFLGTNFCRDSPGPREGAVMIKHSVKNQLLLLYGYGPNDSISSIDEPEFLNEEWIFQFPNCEDILQFNYTENKCEINCEFCDENAYCNYTSDICVCLEGYEKNGLNCSKQSNKLKENNNMIVGIIYIISGSSLLLLVLIIIIVLIILIITLKTKKKDSMEKVLEEEVKQTEAKININRDLFKLNYKELEIKEKIGSGGSNSSIFLAKWNSSLVAFKCFQLNDFDTEKFSEFEKEVEVMISISHPFILRFYGATVAPPRVGIVMEYCPKGDLRAFIENNQSLKEKKRIEILSQIAQGLKYLHSKNIWHRDMKPENVLISDDLSIRIIDFGLSRIMEDINQTKTKAIGTSKYMAPEVVLGEDYNSKIDIYSFGIMLFEILSGNFEPFGKKLQFKLEFKIANDPNFRPDVNEVITEKTELVDLMKSCWRESPKKRPDMSEIVKILEKCIE